MKIHHGHQNTNMETWITRTYFAPKHIRGSHLLLVLFQIVKSILQEENLENQSGHGKLQLQVKTCKLITSHYHETKILHNCCIHQPQQTLSSLANQSSETSKNTKQQPRKCNVTYQHKRMNNPWNASTTRSGGEKIPTMHSTNQVWVRNFNKQHTGTTKLLQFSNNHYTLSSLWSFPLIITKLSNFIEFMCDLPHLFMLQ